MAATAYASLVSLLNTMDQIHTHPLVSTFFDINQNKSLCEKVNFLVDFVEKYSDADNKEVEDLVRRIADAAHEAENILDVHAADRIRGRESPSFLSDLQKITEEMEYIKEEVIKVKVEIECLTSMQPPPPSSSAPPATAQKATTMVGFDYYTHKLLDELLGHDVDRQIISITGMGGIGKTTLARNSYQNPLVMRHFNVHAWITVSQDSTARKVYMQALSCLGGGSIDMDTADDQQLSIALHRTLFNRRYLIVLDDVWSVEILKKIELFFPENRNGSRIVVTTRDSKLVDYIGSFAIAVDFLNEEYSWKLFREKTFPQQDFPPELKEVGKKIVKNCRGLPLAISVVGGLLVKLPGTREHWEKVAEDKRLILKSGENKPSDILYLSYKYLPVCLKPCFLYLGLYPEDHEINAFELIQLWIAEGFIKSKKGQSLEEIGESYINELIDRNLLFLGSVTLSWKDCSIHDLLRDLCLEIGEQENFYCVQRSIDGDRHFIVDQTTARFYPQVSHDLERVSVLNPLVVRVGEGAAQFKTKLLRVFCPDYGSRKCEALQEVNMRFLEDNSCDKLVPSLVSRLWTLQTLVVSTFDVAVVGPAEIWKMPQLRHINIWNFSLPNPPRHSDDGVCVLQNLQTLRTVKDLIFTDEVCKRIPNIKKLGIVFDFRSQSQACPCYHLENLACFNKLESLYYECQGLLYGGDSLQNMIKFPSSIKDLTLTGCMLEWSYMALIASLPHLQYLALKKNSVAATELVFVEEKFVSLKQLDIFIAGVTEWIAQSSNFPVLEKLRMRDLPVLDEIPSGIGEIPTLQSIYLFDCSESANISAVEILHEQERFENLGLQVKIWVREEKAQFLREKIQQLDLTCQNLEII